MEFEDKGRWLFNGLAGAAAGKLNRIVDRNGNQLSLFYDGENRLARVRDTLDRDILIGYNAAGLITTVTDFAGRVVRYDYYGAGEEGGGPGDLKSVTSPAVTGTPHGNDFPNGKTTRYTYTAGFVEERLNHNLLSITDGRRNDPRDPTFGRGPYLVNTYGRSGGTLDRVTRPVWGGDVVDITYVPLLPYGNVGSSGAGGAAPDPPAFGQATMRAIVNDRNGNFPFEFRFLAPLRSSQSSSDSLRSTRSWIAFSADRRPSC